MKRIYALCFLLVVLFASKLEVFPGTLNLINRIEGQVFDPTHRPVQNVYVELLSETDSVIQRTRTNSSGRFTFSGGFAGRLTIKVLPYGTNLMEQSQEVEIIQTRNRTDTAYVDITLRYDKHGRQPATEKSGVVFVQDIPAAAKKLYMDGMANLSKHQDKGTRRTSSSHKHLSRLF
jgi:hypothetical protein